MSHEGEKKIAVGLSATFYRLCVSMTIAITYLSIAGDVSYATGRIYSPFLALLSILVFWCAVCVVFYCTVRVIGLLFINWTRLRWRLRVVKLTICICGLLIIPTAFYHVGPQFNTCLHGFGARIKNKADFADIRNWMMEVDLPPNWYRTFSGDLEGVPLFIKELGPYLIMVDERESEAGLSYRSVDLRWPAPPTPSGIWGLTITQMENQYPPISTSASKVEIEPGVHVYSLSK